MTASARSTPLPTTSRRLWLALVLAVLACACTAGVTPQNELVMRPGDTITARTPAGPLQISAVSEQMRRYRFADTDATVNLDPRPSRWHGSLGLYSAGLTGGIVANEAQYDFTSVPDFLDWIRDHAPQAVYNDQGYIVALGRAPNGRTDIDVYRACIGGDPPSRLPGSRNADVRVEPGPAASSAQTVAWYGCARAVTDPAAQQHQQARSMLDIARQTDFWGLTDFNCPITEGDDAPGPDATPLPGDTELVLRPGERLEIRNRTGTLTIAADDERTRSFAWQNIVPGTAANGRDDLTRHTLTATLEQAPERVAGARGMYGCHRKSGDEHYTLDYVEARLNL
jgi:hypothetical protein